MTWAMRRRLIIIGLIAAVIAVALGLFYATTIRTAPSCFDQKQNQDEEGIDCGGSCFYLCTESRAKPSVRFARAVSPVPGRTDVIAYVDNPNTDAAANDLPFIVELYSPENAVIAKKTGTIDLPPNSTVPIFVSDLFSGSQADARAFITFAEPEHIWFRYRDTRIIPDVRDVALEGSDTPRIRAVAANPSSGPVKNVPFIVTIFDGEGNAIAASRTIVTGIPARGTADLIFTWPSAFSAPVSRIEVVPLVPLPEVP